MEEPLRMVEKESEVEEKVVKEKIDQEKQKEKSLAIFSQSDKAIQVANEMLHGFEIKLEDEESRPNVTGPSGVTVGAGVNFLLDSAVETDPDRKAHKREVGATTLVEIGIGAFKTLIAGERRRRGEGNKLLVRKKQK